VAKPSPEENTCFRLRHSFSRGSDETSPRIAGDKPSTLIPWRSTVSTNVDGSRSASGGATTAAAPIENGNNNSSGARTDLNRKRSSGLKQKILRASRYIGRTRGAESPRLL